jgi:hypothetical protein
MTTYGPATEAAINRVVDALGKFGRRSIVALAGVPGTGKSHIASIAAQRFATDPLMVREIQFHQSFSYEEFIEGLRMDGSGGVKYMPGIFQELNALALEDDQHQYVLLIEEFTRANVAAVLGELLTYLELRHRPFYTMYGRKPIFVAPNIAILATYNPVDRTAVEVDSALLRRLRVLHFPPADPQLAEMLSANGLPGPVIANLESLFAACKKAHAKEYDDLMPFGYGVFADVTAEADLSDLYRQRLRYMLRRPLLDPHPFTDTIEKNYPWMDPSFRVPVTVAAPSTAAASMTAPPAPAVGADVPGTSSEATETIPPLEDAAHEEKASGPA